MRLLTIACASLALVMHSPEAMASGRAMCPGAESGPGWDKGMGVIATKSTDMEGTVYAKGATQCTIKFHDNHKTAPYCMISGPQFEHIIAKVLRTSRSEVTFTFSRPLSSDDGFTYNCMFKD
jgi:hypothetical protein